MSSHTPFRYYGIQWAAAVWLLILFVPSPGRTQSESTMPLAVGNSWTYTSDLGELTISVADPVTILGRQAFRVVFDRGQSVDYEEYLSWSGQGELLLHGRRLTSTPPVVFEPPLVWFTPGLQEGRGGTVQVYADFEGTTTPDSGTYYVAYMGEETVTVPAGTYATTHVDDLATGGEARWYTPDVGLVQLQYPAGLGRTFVLLSHNLTVAVDKSSWSNLKALYR